MIFENKCRILLNILSIVTFGKWLCFMYNFQKKKEEKYSDGKHLRSVMSCKRVYYIIVLYYVSHGTSSI